MKKIDQMKVSTINNLTDFRSEGLKLQVSVPVFNSKIYLYVKKDGVIVQEMDFDKNQDIVEFLNFEFDRLIYNESYRTKAINNIIQHLKIDELFI